MRIFFIAVLTCLVAAGCRGSETHAFTGRTMGTTYQIKIVASSSVDLPFIRKSVEDLLEQINQSLSTYRPDSEISRFNAFTDTAAPFPISDHFLRVMQIAAQVYELSQGAWDGTLNPLVNRWGFGKAGVLSQIPEPEQIKQDLSKVGFRHIVVHTEGFLTKKIPDVSLDLASIAKGYAVDQVSLLLGRLGYNDHLVEIGGEVFASGRRSDGRTWRVGINTPEKGASADAIYKALDLEGQAMATSGDYRNFYEIQGRTYSHIIDPRTGYPVRNTVVSASVIAGNCGYADALATALMVMGPEQGIALLDRLDGVEGVVIVRSPEGELHPHWSGGIVSPDRQ